MAERPRTRQDLYEQIRRTSKEEFILEDMIRLGFWPARSGPPDDPAEEIRRRGELQRQLEALRAEQSRLYNEKKLLEEHRKKRLAESRKKRQETKERRERERKERAAAWRARNEREIGYLGEGVSGGLSATESDAARLRAQGLPYLCTPAELAAAMGLGVPALRFLAFSRRTAPISHYVRFRLPKKTGGTRLISAPMPRLKRAQAWVLDAVLRKLGTHDAAHGFCAGRSIVSNARPHLGRGVVVNVDLKDFFPTVGYPRVKGLFRALGYSDAVATVLALLCTEPEVEEVELDGRRYFVALTERRLPQGAPTSPAITNLLCRRLDRRLERAARDLGFAYTRYADDLSFSASGDDVHNVGALLKRLRAIVAHEGFVVHPDKTRVQRRAGRQEVTGIVVNGARPSLSRDVLRRFRATLFQIEKDGPAGKRWGEAKDVLAAIKGFADYAAMVDPARGAPLQARVRAILEKNGWRPPRTQRKARAAPAPAATPAAAAPSATTPGGTPAPAPEPAKDPAKEPEKPKKKWWKLF